MAKGDTSKLGKLFVLIGGIVGLLMGILLFLNMGISVPFIGFAVVAGLVAGALQVIVSLIVLATSGAVDIPALKLENNGVVMLILGIILYIVGGNLGGLLVIIGGILLLL